MEVTTAVVLTFAAILVSIPNVAAGSLTYDLSYSLPVVFVFIALVVIITVIVCVMYRARQGYFCCLSPRPVYRVRRNNVEDGRNGTQAASQNGSLTAPDYHTVPANANIAPPDYRDALHDVIVPEGEQQAPPDYTENGQPDATSDQPAGETTQAQQPLTDVELNDDSTESYDDTTPLNP